MAEKLSCGRYKSKTFEYVYTTDKDYCFNVYNNNNNSQDYNRGNLNEFKKYLAEKFGNSTISTSSDPDPRNIIRQIYGRDFIAEFNREHKKELNRLIPNFSNITVRAVTVKSRKNKTSGILGVFYRLFTKKLLYSMIKKANICYNNTLLILINIFPVPLQFKCDGNGSGMMKDDKTSRMIKALQSDQSALMEIEQFISKYQFDISNISTDAAHMLTTINRFVGNVDDVSKSLLSIHFFINSRSQYLTVFNQHFLFYLSCKDSFLKCLKYRDRLCPFRVVQFDQLLQRMDALCDYRTYVTHTGNIMELVEVIFKLAVFIDSQLYYAQIDNTTIKDVDYSVLENIIQYIKNLGSSETFIVNPSVSLLNYLERQASDDFSDEELLNILSIRPDYINVMMSEKFVVDKCFLKSGHTLYSNGSLIELYYSKRSKCKIQDFYRLILSASLLELPCTKVVIYNPQLGEETQVEIDKEKEPIKNFIRKFHHPYAWKDVQWLGDLV